jgi:hypothetical protein
MIIKGTAVWEDVIGHWVEVEAARKGCTKSKDEIKIELMNNNFIVELLPYLEKIKWIEAEIEQKDISEFYVISSIDWLGFSNSYSLEEICFRYTKKTYHNLNDFTLKKILKIDGIQNAVYSEESIDLHPIALSRQIEGYFTIIDGCHRAVALQSINKLVGNTVYLGISPFLTCYRYHWMCH